MQILNIVMQQIKRRVGIIGALSYSGANFALTFLLQAAVPASDFGLYAFALICIQFGISLSNALFASPIVVSLVDLKTNRLEVIGSYFWINLIFIGLATFAMCLTLILLGMAWNLIVIVSIQAIAIWMRWFIRAVELAEKRFTMAAWADVSYGFITIISGIILFSLNGINELNVLSAMAIGAIFSAFIIGRKGWSFSNILANRSMQKYRDAFNQHGRWALVGVVTTEIMANLHVYVLTLYLGPTYFAPVATLSLFFRLIPILMQSITQYERPVLAKFYYAGDFHLMRSNVQSIHFLLLGAVVLNTLAVAVIIKLNPILIGGGQYSPSLLWPILVLLSLGQLVRSLRTGSSAALQGAGKYKLLALVTVMSAPVTLILSALVLVFMSEVINGILFSVLIGEVVTCILISHIYKKLLSEKKFR